MKIIIVGGGAAGFFSAISAAEMNPNAQVTIYESTSNLLSKVLISGGGRCNVTNNTLDVNELVKNYPRGSKELKSPFSRFSVKDTIEWFKNKQIRLKIEPDNRMFPITDTSKTIAECLFDTASKLKIKVLTKSKITKIENINISKFRVYTNNETTKFTEVDKIIFTTGGTKGSFELLKNLGHSITELVPSLFSFEINDIRFSDLAGVSFSDIRLKLGKHTQRGPLLITHWGLSGPAAIKLSAFAAKELYFSKYQAELKINFIPDENFESVLKNLIIHKENNPKSIVKSDFFLNIPKRFWNQIVEKIETKEKQTWIEFSKKQLQLLASELTGASYQISAKGKFKDEFVTCGGVSLKEVNFKTMESKIIPGLFFAGEVLDIDGITGGFNFQAAWTTGWIAGRNTKN